MDQEHEDYRDGPTSSRPPGEIEQIVGWLLVPALLAIIVVGWCALGFIN